MYEDEKGRNTTSDPPLYEQRRRTQSTASQNPYIPPSDPSQYPRTATQANGRRGRSPSFSSYGKSSDPNVRDIPGGYYASEVYEEEEEKRKFTKEADMRRGDWARQAEHPSAGHQRRSTAGTDSSYDSQPRSVYEDDYYRGRGGNNGYDSRSGYETRRY